MSSSSSSPSDSPRRDIDDLSDASSVSSEEQETNDFADKKKSFLGHHNLELDVPDDVWLAERKCLLMLLEARMLLREMVEYKLQMVRMASGNLTIAEIQNLLAINPDGDDDKDFISEIQELKKQLVKEIRKNHSLERELAKLDNRIALLIANRTSIQEIDRQKKKQQKQIEDAGANTGKVEDFSQDKKKLESYANLFYALQVEPKYLAKIAFVLPNDKTESFVDMALLTLYGDAFSPREEYLILQLFKYAMEYEIAHTKNVADLVQTDTVVPKLVLTYNKRKQGVEYIKNTLSGLIMKEMMIKEYNFELKPLTIYQKIVNEADIKQGKKNKMKRDVSAEEAAADSGVQSIIAQRTKELQEVCQVFLDKILNSMSSLPYGIRLICKQIRTLLLQRFPKAKPDEIWQIVGYFVYYRFIGLAIVSPDSFDIGGRDLSLGVRKNLMVVSKVLYNLFRLGDFSKTDEYAPMNPWIQSNRKAVLEYFNDLVDVLPPEEFLQVNQYMELTQKTKPLIIISLKEVVETHSIVAAHIDQVIKDKNDPLQLILKDLGDVPKISPALETRDIQLTLENKFKGTMEDEIKPGAHTYAETKELIIQIFKAIPIKTGPQTLAGILKESLKYAKDNNNKTLQKNVEKATKNMEKLEEQGLITKKDKYASLLKDVALEVANRAERREQQQKEIARLQATLKNLKKHQEFMTDQIGEFEKYLDSCRKNSAANVKLKSKPIKFPYKELTKRGVILESEVPDHSKGRTKFFISMPGVGVFDIEAKIAGISVGKMQLELEDLLEKKENNITRLELDQVVLNVQSTIFLINKHFLS